jgi:hypothetical protein
MTWNETFLTLFDRCVQIYQGPPGELGERELSRFYQPGDLRFLESIGCQPREFFDFVEDFCEENEPSPSTALLVAAVRRDYFLTIQNGRKSDRVLTRDEVPGFGEELAGMSYLPRILAKGRAKLRGELDPDLMFGCGGDRAFLARHGQIHLADFLRHLWAAGDDDHKMAVWIQSVS